MAKFIPTDKIKKLREAARNGDANARKILNMQLGGEEDYTELLDSYFAPKPEPQPETVVSGVGKQDDQRLAKYLSDNGITKDSPDYDQAIKEFYAEIGENPEEPSEEENYEEIIKSLLKEESKAIDDYSKAITKVMNLSDFDERQIKRAIARFTEIRDDEMEHYKELKALLKNNNSEEESELL